MVAAFMALLGANTASATVLCKTTTVPCNSPATEVDLSLSGSSTSSAEGITLGTCSGGTMKGVVTSQGATGTANLSVASAGLTWTGCTNVTTSNEGGTIEIHAISGTDNGTFTAKGFVWTKNTIFGSCAYGFGIAAKDLGTLVGGAPATLAINTNIPRISGPCPATETWVANYTVTSPSPLYVVPS